MTKHTFLMMALIAIFFLVGGCGDSGQEIKQTENAQPADNSADKNVALIINLNQISGKSPGEVETVLGKAESTEKVTGFPCEKMACQKATFKNGQYEIIFKAEKADRITINNVPNLIDNDNALVALGLPAGKPSFRNPNVLANWKDQPNIHEISFFTDYILIQVSKPD